MAKKISELSPYDGFESIENLYALGYNGADGSSTSNYRISLKKLLDKIWEVKVKDADTTLKDRLDNLTDAIESISSEDSELLAGFENDETIKNFFENIQVEDGSDKTITATFIISEIIKKINYPEEFKLTDKELIDKVRDDLDINSFTLKEFLLKIIDKISTQGGSGNNPEDKPESGPTENPENNDSSLDLRISVIERAINIDDKLNASGKELYIVDSTSPEDFRTYKEMAESYNSLLKSYAENNGQLINKDNAQEKLNVIKGDDKNHGLNYIESTYFTYEQSTLTLSSEADADGNISYDEVTEIKDNISKRLSEITNICDIINKFDNDNSTSDTENYIYKFENIYNEFINDVSENYNISSLSALLNDIKKDRDELDGNLQSSKWYIDILSSVNTCIEIINSKAVDDIISKDEISGSLEQIKTDLPSSIVLSESFVVSEVITEIKTIINDIDSKLLEIVPIEIDKNEIIEELKSLYEEIETEFDNLISKNSPESINQEPPSVSEEDISKNFAIQSLKTLLNEANKYFDINDTSSKYISNKINEAKQISLSSKQELDSFIKHIKDIYDSKDFIQERKTGFDEYFEDLNRYSSDYKYYWNSSFVGGELTISDYSNILIEIAEKLYNPELITFDKSLSGELLEVAIDNSHDKLKAELKDAFYPVIRENVLAIYKSTPTGEVGNFSETLTEHTNAITTLNNAITTLNNTVENVKTEVSYIDPKFKVINDKISTNIASINEKLSISEIQIDSLEEKSESLSEELKTVKSNISNYAGFIDFGIEPEILTVDMDPGNMVIIDRIYYYKLTMTNSGILYISKKDNNPIKFIPYRHDGTSIKLSDFWKNVYCPENGLEQDLVSIPMLKNTGILIPQNTEMDIKFMPYISSEVIDNIIS